MMTLINATTVYKLGEGEPTARCLLSSNGNLHVVFSYYRDLRETIDMVYRAMKPPKTIVVVAC